MKWQVLCHSERSEESISNTDSSLRFGMTHEFEIASLP